MHKIYSKTNNNKLLHIVNWLQSSENERHDIAPDDQFLQVATIASDKGKSYRAHKHIWKTPAYPQTIAQESWIVVRGSVKVYFYDTDDTLLESHVIKQGDCSVTFEGGHSYEILEDNTLVYEYKTGPYYGQTLDKVFLDKS